MMNMKKLMLALSLTATTSVVIAQENTLMIDGFDHQKQTNIGIERVYITDVAAGGGTQANSTIKEGVIHLKGDILPPRGQPGWSSLVLPLAAMGQAFDASKFDGIRLTLKISKGSFSISANSSEVTNFDYHAAPIMAKADNTFHTIDIPFESMKRAWSQQTTLNKKTLNSLSIVAYGLQKSSFDFEVDTVSFY
ncbi:CIA30 family protein [Psychrobium sp. nBUS_13]|uniref:CIA30 family protein n=1 Tax=Psychrobium sp. nBUS_13 TaxID=3395319 RepID=UPI003EBABDD4